MSRWMVDELADAISSPFTVAPASSLTLYAAQDRVSAVPGVVNQSHALSQPGDRNCTRYAGPRSELECPAEFWLLKPTPTEIDAAYLFACECQVTVSVFLDLEDIVELFNAIHRALRACPDTLSAMYMTGIAMAVVGLGRQVLRSGCRGALQSGVAIVVDPPARAGGTSARARMAPTSVANAW
jgi:hypothetical protein